MHAHEIVREFQRIFGETAEVEYALHADKGLDEIAVHVSGWPEWSLYRDTYRLLTVLRSMERDAGTTKEGDAALCARIEAVHCLVETVSLRALTTRGWEVRED